MILTIDKMMTVVMIVTIDYMMTSGDVADDHHTILSKLMKEQDVR